MDMVLVRPDLHEMDLVPLSDFQADLFQSILHCLGKDFPPILGRAHDVVEEERFVVPLEDVFAHSPILPHVISHGDIYGKGIRAAELRGMF